ncbi:MAG: TonB-dependent receptor [Burkholderiaceae bacterium]
MKQTHRPLNAPLSALAAAALALLAGAAHAQTAAPAAPEAQADVKADAPAAKPAAKPAPAAAELNSVTVTGIRASKDKSMVAKRAAGNVTEVISAEDIGKMPDKNVADALQRLPGVVTTAGSGGQGGYDENDRVSLRGTSPSMALTTLNGHTVSSADWDPSDQIAGGAGSAGSGAARSVSYLLLPSEIVSEVVVHKSAQADQLEGGIAGSIDIVTRRALSFRKPFTAELSLQGVYADLSKKTDPQVSGLFAWKNDASTAGVVLQLFDETRHIRRDAQAEIAYGTISPTSAAGTANGGALAGKYYIASVVNSVFEQKRERKGGVLSAEFKPLDNLTLNVEGFYSKLDASYTNSRMVMRPSNSIVGGVVPTNVQLDGNVITAAQFNNTGNATGSQLESMLNPVAGAQTKYLNADFKYQVNDQLKITGMGGQTRAQSDALLYWNYQFLPNTTTAYQSNGVNSSSPVTASFPNGIAPNVLTYLPGTSGADNSASGQHSADKETYFQLDSQYTPLGSIFESFKFGARYADHSREGTRPLKTGAPENAAKNGQITITSSPTYGGDTFPGNFGNNLGGGASAIAGVFPTLSSSAVQSWSDQNLSADPVFNRPVSGVFQVKEKVTAAYAMANLAGESWRGNFGLRVVNTKTTVTTNTPVACGVPTATNGVTFGSPEQATLCASFVPPGGTLVTGSRFGNFYIGTTSTNNTEVLPSANFAIDATPDVQLRAAVAKVMTRPDYSALGATISGFGYNVANATPSTASGGNPLLKPQVAINYNLGAEWYFAKRSLLSAQFFYLDFSRLISAGTSMQTLYNTAVPSGQGGPQLLPTAVSSPVMTTGRSKGIELGYEQPIWNNFGVQANYTYADAKEASGAPMLGSSRNSYTLGGYFENDTFSARLTWSHRSPTRVGLYGQSQAYMAGIGNLAGSLNYKVTDSLTLTFDALNLNNPVQRYYNAASTAVPFDATTALYSSGRQYYAGLRYKY